ncbi:hypothetical protein I0J99_08355 [Sinorhizobium meliloti]|uniref:hypothetical protein n=1 Tax=Rhizobium meliloti TaxID=382 RepID=UPI0018DA3771|nr:hypothetical protein [Sinorhizobium meliloti]QPI27235.1 hypothetical protein I0J99_08355 [Sinorhizobium meliloti]
MRHDHTNWLTHFVRDRNPDQDFPGGDEDDCGFFAGGELEIDASAFQVLKTIIRLGGITPGYSFRNGRTTIYGGRPAICVTEMPLYSFATYVKSRGDTAKASAYGIAFLKAEFFTAGGRPVIYGLSTDNPNYKENTTTSRIFCDSVLPLSEQYRYVAFNPSSRTNWIDWSHEREWRWIVQDPDRDHIWLRDYHGVYDTAPGLPLFKGAMEGGAFTRVCVIVWDREEAAEIQELLTGLYLAGSNNYGTPFERNLIAASHIVVLEDVIDAVEKGNKLNSDYRGARRGKPP